MNVYKVDIKIAHLANGAKFAQLVRSRWSTLGINSTFTMNVAPCADQENLHA